MYSSDICIFASLYVCMRLSRRFKYIFRILVWGCLGLYISTWTLLNLPYVQGKLAALASGALKQVLNNAYDTAGSDTDFRAFVDSQGFGRNDLQIPEIILKVYDKAMCHKDPEKWLDECCRLGDVSAYHDVSETIWGEYLINDLHSYIDEQIKSFEKIMAEIADNPDFSGPYLLLSDTIAQMRELRDCESWDDIIAHKTIDYGKLNFSKKADPQTVEYIKLIRNGCKKRLQAKLTKFSETSEHALAGLKQIEPALRGTVAFTKRFISTYQKLKRSRKALDFSDLEQYSLDLLIGKDRTAPTLIADEIGNAM